MTRPNPFSSLRLSGHNIDPPEATILRALSDSLALPLKSTGRLPGFLAVALNFERSGGNFRAKG